MTRWHRSVRIEGAGRAAVLWFLLSLCASLGEVASAAEGDRVALVIGNAEYQRLEKLSNTTNDARALAEKLGTLGFKVTHLEDLGRREMVLSISRWLGSTRAGQTALVYYAGHGVEVNGSNYLLPVDMPKIGTGEESVIRSEGISLDNLLADVTASAASRGIVILDACRDNPLTSGTRSVGGTRGMARVENPFGTFVMYAAGARQTALDRSPGQNRHGLFTKVLLKHLDQEKLELRRLAITVRDEVSQIARSTFGHLQIPSYYDQMQGDFFFKPARQAAVSEARSFGQSPVFWGVDQLRTALDGKTFVFGEGEETIYFSSRLKNTLTQHLGADFMKKNIRKDVVAQLPFLAKIRTADGGTEYIEGIGGIAKGTRKRGSALFLLQSTAADKTIERFARGERVFSTLRIKGTADDPACTRSHWQNLLKFSGKLSVGPSSCQLRAGNHLIGK
ncbi:MAG: caspase family protein [Pseudomonadota bacterium]